MGAGLQHPAAAGALTGDGRVEAPPGEQPGAVPRQPLHQPEARLAGSPGKARDGEVGIAVTYGDEEFSRFCRGGAQVGVEEEKDVVGTAGTDRQSHAQRRALAGVLRLPDHLGAGVLRQARGVIRRTVVDHHHPSDARQRPRRPHGIGNPRRLLIGGDEGDHPHSIFTIITPA